jgi:hypothetical protein
METHRQGADGHRLFTAQFKQEQIARLAREELTLAEPRAGAVGLLRHSYEQLYFWGHP